MGLCIIKTVCYLFLRLGGFKKSVMLSAGGEKSPLILYSSPFHEETDTQEK